MKDLRFVVLGAALAAAAAPIFAAPRRCANGFEPTLSGDAFSPVQCSTTMTVAALTGVPARVVSGAKTDLKDLAGRWEGMLIHALGRYELLLTVTTHWRGKAELTLALKEQQFRERLRDRLDLAPERGPGLYDAELTTDRAPGLALKGRLALGTMPDGRQADLIFANGAAHRLYFQLKGQNELRVRSVSAVPGAPLQSLETVLHRTKRQSL